MIKEEDLFERDNQWTGKTFDEAQYYLDDKSTLGLEKADESIKETILEAISRNGKFNVSRIEVSVREGSVTLHGDAPLREELSELQKMIKTLSGVKTVTIKIKSQD